MLSQNVILLHTFLVFLSGEYSNPQLEELIEWVNKTIPEDKSMAGKIGCQSLKIPCISFIPVYDNQAYYLKLNSISSCS